MSPETFIASIETEWEPEAGFFWKIRQGDFHNEDFEGAYAKVAAVPHSADKVISARLVSVLWYIPLLMQWQVERVREAGGDTSAYSLAISRMTAEVERILGIP
jgi:hypothetical protein